MSGRDLRMFVTNYRTEDTEKLIIRMKYGLKHPKFKPVDYQQLQALAEAKKLASHDIELKIKKTFQAAKRNKDNSLIKQHRHVWWPELQKLVESRQKVESEVHKLLESASIDDSFITEMKDYGMLLFGDQEVFKTATVDPIWQLMEDLKKRLFEHQNCGMGQPHQIQKINSNQILQEVESVKSQQKLIMDKLGQEILILEEQIKDFKIEEDFPPQLNEIPEEIEHFRCPYPDLKATILNEFQNLNEKYRSQLEDIGEWLKVTDRNCEWSENDHWIFRVIVEVYSPEVQNRNQLYMDMLQRLLPDKSKHALVDHGRLWDQYRFNQEHQRVLIRGWTRDRKDLLMNATMTLTEACFRHEAEVILVNNRRKQQEICAELKHKVQQMRTHQEEIARLEAAIVARKREQEEEKQRKEIEKERNRRAVDRETIKQFYTEKERKREEAEQRDKKRLEELKSIMANQADVDRERVWYRQEMLEKRIEEKKAMALQKMKEEEERQKRLDVFWQKMGVVAECDPVRMMSDTEASKARLRYGAEEEFFLQKPLFSLATYTDKQFIADPRIRIELALREAGLHNTFYAREVLSKIPPPRPPRRDLESTLFKD
ncbi:coiled-coil domain-containing protein 148 isoform X1 [Callorhinchus milii]|nr:coiled-coil domain-containing protein 148 isoform X1 [Callorhinchus milii]XP_007888093.1 coiled-coil domain-containing protein 148 isoform X1 [Callorhinchus milii]XP_007888094.1 coiled-coil domain-containing protein 148 isoform X1 [Callorhinchus milii]XP_042192324.1 coiled-coil domain-containing protein 148 isoform X1 [Callorhinchus milii]|eukprot:gi/632945493/ref/XP_007888092.1/ PREDICTED: coiled-coil domain-containing protein 148 isoform X1 [Callorhinchus milii]